MFLNVTSRWLVHLTDTTTPSIGTTGSVNTSGPKYNWRLSLLGHTCEPRIPYRTSETCIPNLAGHDLPLWYRSTLASELDFSHDELPGSQNRVAVVQHRRLWAVSRYLRDSAYQARAGGGLPSGRRQGTDGRAGGRAIQSARVRNPIPSHADLSGYFASEYPPSVGKGSVQPAPTIHDLTLRHVPFLAYYYYCKKQIARKNVNGPSDAIVPAALMGRHTTWSLMDKGSG